MTDKDPIFRDSKEMFKKDKVGERVLMWSSQTNCNVTGNSEVIAVDSTYPTAKGFRQVFIVHAQLKGQFGPTVYFWMESKSQSSYRKAFRMLKSVIVS